jgi:hypothetical protein
MRIVHLSLLTVALVGTLAEDWNVSPDCRRRRTFDPNEPIMSAVMKRSESVSPDKSLRGSEASANRQLQEGSQMWKMYWEPGYCWQEEWDQRLWCLKCDGSCTEGVNLEIDECNEADESQWFILESADDGIKLKPSTDPSLCWTRFGGAEYQLMPCGDDYGLDQIIIMDFQENDSSFELHPSGRPDDCLVNDDHREYIYRNPLCSPSYDVPDKLLTSSSSLSYPTDPRWDEDIRAFPCRTARGARTSLWEVFMSEENGAVDDDDTVDDDDDTVDDDN